MYNSIIKFAQAVVDFFMAQPLVVTIPTWKVDLFQTEFASMAKKAARYGVEAPKAVALSDSDIVVEKTRYVNGYDHEGRPTVLVQRHKVPCRAFFVTGLVPKVQEKYTLLAKVEFLNGKALVHPIREDMIVPDQYLQGQNFCDHCGKNRARKLAFIVQEIETGKYSQIGSTCVDEFFGTTSLQYLTWTFASINNAIGLCSEHEDLGDSGSQRILTGRSVEEYVACVASVIREHGKWMSSDSSNSTRGYAEVTFSDQRLIDQHVTMEDRHTAAKWIAQAHELFVNDPVGSFGWNILTALSCDRMYTRSMYGILAALPRAIEKATEVKIQEVAKAQSQYVGTVGKREVFTLAYVKTFSFDTMYGTQHIHSFVDANNNAFIWKTNKGSLYVGEWLSSETVVKAGDIVEIKATVKEHSEYRGTKQTVLTRASLLSAVEPKE